MVDVRSSVKDIITKWITIGWQKGNDRRMAELLSDDFIDHDSSGRTSDVKGFTEGVKKLYSSFPDFYASIETIIWDKKQQMAAVRWSARGTHWGEYLGYPATGKVIKFKGIELLEIKENLITQRWGEWDGFDIIEQIK